MKIILATGIYPPAIGGPATYCHALAGELTKMGHEVEVVTYGRKLQIANCKLQTNYRDGFRIHNVGNTIPLLRWFAYAKKLREVGRDADIVYALSSVSCGVPLVLSRLKKPKRVLRLGGDFFWERYTDAGGKKGLREWYEEGHWSLVIGHWFMERLLRNVDHIVFSTDFQRDIYKKSYKKLPEYSVIENALAIDQVVPMEHHIARTPFRLLFVGRFVSFKNILSLLRAVAQIPDAYLTLVGQGPQGKKLRKMTERLGLDHRVRFVGPLSGKQKFEIFATHDLLIIPSFTDISPNTALEARSVGLPVLLTKENGLSRSLIPGIAEAKLLTPEDIVKEIMRVRQGYSLVAEAACAEIKGRSWEEIALETNVLFSQPTPGKN